MDLEVAATTTATSTEAASVPTETEPQSTSQPQVADTPTTATDTQVPANETAAERWDRERIEKLRAEDPDFKKHHSDLVNQEAQRLAADMRRREKLAKAKDDPEAALEFAQSEYQAVEAEESKVTQAREAETRAHAELADLCRNRAWADEYEALRTGRLAKEFNERYAKDPVAFIDWADQQVTDALIERRAAEKAKPMAEAMALDMNNKQLAAMPQFPTGGGSASDDALLASVAGMTLKQYQDNKDAILAAESRRIKRLTG